MQYRHTPRFQALLQKALRQAARDQRYSDQKMIEAAGLACKKSTLNRFRGSPVVSDGKSIAGDADEIIDRAAGSFLNLRDARSLWNYLDNTLGLIETVIGLHHDPTLKTSMYPVSEVANAMHAFFGVHKSSIQKFAEAEISKHFFCYKPSFRRPGFVVKARLTMKSENNDFFEVEEVQRTSDLFESDAAEIIETSAGFGFVKTNRLWIFMRDTESEQPRIFCFNHFKFAHPKSDTPVPTELLDRVAHSKKSKIMRMEGYLIEGAKGNVNDAFQYHAMLVSEDLEREIWRDRGHPAGDVFRAEDQVDIFPVGRAEKAQYAEQMKRSKIQIPEFVLEYLASDLKLGNRR
jgi:hypothetical protein